MNDRKTPFTLSVDTDADAAYIKMTSRKIAETREVGDGVMVDLDDMGMVVGIEILGLESRIPFDRLTEEFHVHSDDVTILRSIQPSISGFLMQFSTDGSSSRNELEGSVARQLVS